MSHLVLALDPGGTTGLAMGRIRNNNLLFATTQERMTLLQMYTLLESIAPDPKWHVVWETFEYRYRGRPGLDQTPIKLIALMELMGETYNGNRWWPQTAAEGKAYYTDERLKQMSLYQKGNPHARDALRHLLRWCTFGFGGTLINMQTAQVLWQPEWQIMYEKYIEA